MKYGGAGIRFVSIRSACTAICSLTAALCVSILCPKPASAVEVLFSDRSLTLLAGRNYEVDPARNFVATFEAFTAFDFGDNYIFIDGLYFPSLRPGQTNRTTFYGEITQRFSLGRTSGLLPQTGFVRDILVSANYEEGEGPLNTILLGASIDLDIGQYFQLNVYRRNRMDGTGWDGWQITPVAAFPFTVGGEAFLIDGFADIVFDSTTLHDYIHINPQIKWRIIPSSKNAFWLGIELDYWDNKYGIPNSKAFDTRESVAYSLLLRYHF